jgi:hypothetical protein
LQVCSVVVRQEDEQASAGRERRQFGHLKAVSADQRGIGRRTQSLLAALDNCAQLVHLPV